MLPPLNVPLLLNESLAQPCTHACAAFHNACTALQTRLCSVPKRLFSVARHACSALQTRLYSVTNRLFSVAVACTAPPRLQPILACTCMSPPRHRVTTGIPCPHVDSLALHCIFSNEQCWQHRNILLRQRKKLRGLPCTHISERHSLRKLVCMCVCVFALLPCIPLPLRPILQCGEILLDLLFHHKRHQLLSQMAQLRGRRHGR